MRYRPLGHSGLRVSELGLGCNNLGGRVDLKNSEKLVSHALDLGVTLFDVADVYGRRDAYAGASEEALGAALAGKRNKAIIATKFGMKMCAGEDDARRASGASRRYIIQAVEASLKRLGTDWIDLYQLHTPDPGTPIEETLATLDDLIRAGKIRYAGVSNLPAWQVADAWHIARGKGYAGFISCQDELSLLARDALSTLVPALRHFGIGLLPYFPLASGMLTGKYKRHTPPPIGSRLSAWTYLQDRYEDPAIWHLLEALENLAHQSGRTLSSLAFNWLLRHDIVGSVIAGATTIEQLESNHSACSTPLTENEYQELCSLLDAQGTAS